MGRVELKDKQYCPTDLMGTPKIVQANPLSSTEDLSVTLDKRLLEYFCILAPI